jgi:predicted alpha/beta-hydrolase family hydrolase
MAEFLTTGAKSARCHVLLAHGAGAPMTVSFLEKVAQLCAERGMTVHRFEFAYMAQRRIDGRRRPPPRAEGLTPEYRDIFGELLSRIPRDAKLMIGGKSMGGRVASLCADNLYSEGRIAGLVCLGYPFHPPGKPDALRTAHLSDLRCPTLIVQGERDPFGSKAEVGEYQLSPAINICWISDGDHDLAPRGGSGSTRADNLAGAADAVAAFAHNPVGL